MSAGPVRALRRPLLAWYRRNRRDLPWRRTRDPYAIWVSEVMLQQTRVDVVVPYWERFLARFPDPAALAAADEEDVLALWTGLGYYRRARSLHAGAKAVVARHGGRVPADPAALRALPGVGRYTAGAVASIAFGLAEPVLDGNVRRVLCRLLGVGAEGVGAAEERRLWDAAAELARGASPGDLNQALMELGATVCAPRNPRCADCPVSARCAARAAGDPERWPAARARRRTTRHDVAVAWIERGGRVLLERRRADNPLRGRWELPAVLLDGERDADRGEARLRETLAAAHGLDVAVGPERGAAEHGILQRRLRLSIRPCRLRRGRVAGREALRWQPADALDGAAVSGATLKAARIARG